MRSSRDAARGRLAHELHEDVFDSRLNGPDDGVGEACLAKTGADPIACLRQIHT